jgi:hypothetical protein
VKSLLFDSVWLDHGLTPLERTVVLCSYLKLVLSQLLDWPGVVNFIMGVIGGQLVAERIYVRLVNFDYGLICGLSYTVVPFLVHKTIPAFETLFKFVA